MKIIIVLLVFSTSGVIGYHFGEEFRLAEKPAEFIGTTISILAAALFAVVSIIGSPSMIVPGNKRDAWESAKANLNELHKFNLLFVWYILTLGLLVSSELIEHAKFENFYWVSNIALFFSAVGFFFSLFVPSMFARIQKVRMEKELSSRKGGV